MTNFHELNAPLCHELIKLMKRDLPITHVLPNGDVGALYYIIKESGVRNTYLNQLMDGLEKRKTTVQRIRLVLRIATWMHCTKR